MKYVLNYRKEPEAFLSILESKRNSCFNIIERIARRQQEKFHHLVIRLKKIH